MIIFVDIPCKHLIFNLFVLRRSHHHPAQLCLFYGACGLRFLSENQRTGQFARGIFPGRPKLIRYFHRGLSPFDQLVCRAIGGFEWLRLRQQPEQHGLGGNRRTRHCDHGPDLSSKISQGCFHHFTGISEYPI